MTHLTRTFRLAIGTAAMLALMSSAAQARPLTFTSSSAPSSAVVQLSPDRADHIGALAPGTPTPLAPDRVDKIGTDQQPTPPTPPVTRVVVRTTDGGFDWLDAAIGAGSALALVLVASAGLVARGRRREPLSA
jgi:hypothetical protein